MYGQSPTAFVDRLKIDDACRQLSSNQISITQLAYDLGFKTSQHFATVFKKYTGHTPSHWRNTQKNNVLK
ncbi:helix-turn-helix domain-containing protein [Litoribacterium kuwaitense]|uniref:helix-turn-helix domain-containing protein n=1 Tax=Litoribacterium kuwaitense TaxID=1398745 RepID=UPI0035E3F792